MSVVTKTGDKGQTGLFGGKRVPKYDTRIEAYGTVDELNAVLGICTADAACSNELRQQLLDIQRVLFAVGADLATPSDSKAQIKRLDMAAIERIEAWIVALEASLLPLTKFILLGGSPLGAQLHLARTICRRAERRTVLLQSQEEMNPLVLIFLNRLSDYLFLAAREANRQANVEDEIA